MSLSMLLRLLVLLIVVAAIAAGLALPEAREFFKPIWYGFLNTVKRLGVWGPIILAASYVVASVLVFPGLPLSLGAGYLFGPLVGTAAASVGSTLGAGAAFLVGRTLARGIVEGKVARDAQFRALDRAVADKGFKIVLLVRLAPIFPFNLTNYAFGLTKVRFRDYFWASWIGMFPATAFNVYLGSLLESLADLSARPAPASSLRTVVFYAGLAATVVATVYVTRVARAALKKAAPDVEEPSKCAAVECSGSDS
jgi:uncharacterized membrane protein YdjX (TVP38/TMEM64 family)